MAFSPTGAGRELDIEIRMKRFQIFLTVEDCRLQTAERLAKYIALISVVGWRIFWLVHISRADPNSPAEVVLTQVEIGTLRCSNVSEKKSHKKDPSLSIKPSSQSHASADTLIEKKISHPELQYCGVDGSASPRCQRYTKVLLLVMGNSEGMPLFGVALQEQWLTRAEPSIRRLLQLSLNCLKRFLKKGASLQKDSL